MAFEKKKTKKSCVLLFLATLIIEVSLSNATNYDCKGKAFYCLNSTHFIICVDLGDGMSTAVEDFVIPCPPPTICTESNVFECEYQTTILKTVKSEDIEPASEINLETSRDYIDFTTIIPFLYNKDDSVKSEKYYDTIIGEEKISLTAENEYITETTQPTLQAESTTETEIITEAPLHKETAVPSQEENSNFVSSSAGEITESNTFDYKIATTTVEKVSQNVVAEVHDYITTSLTENYTIEDTKSSQPTDASKVITPEEYEYITMYSYENNFDTVSTTTLSERATTERIKTSQTIENVSKAIVSGEYDYITTSNYKNHFNTTSTTTQIKSSTADTESDQPAQNVSKSIVSEEYGHITTSYYGNQFETVNTTTMAESFKPEEIKTTQPVTNVTKASDYISTSVYEHNFDTVSPISSTLEETKTTQSAENVLKTIVPGDNDHITTSYIENHFETVSTVEKTTTSQPTNNTSKSIVSGDYDSISTSIYEHNFDTMGTTTLIENLTTEETNYYTTETKTLTDVDEFSIPSDLIFNNQETSQTLHFYTDQAEVTTHLPFNLDATSQETFTSTSYRQLSDSPTTSYEKSEIFKNTSGQISDIASTTEKYKINESSIYYPEIVNIPLDRLKNDYGFTDSVDNSVIYFENVTSFYPTQSFDNDIVSHSTKMDKGNNYQNFNTGIDILNKITIETTTNIYDINTDVSINSPHTNTKILEGLEKLTSSTSIYAETETVVQSEYSEAINMEEQRLLLSTDTGNIMQTDLEEKSTNLNVETNYQLSTQNSFSPSVATITITENNTLENIFITNVEYKTYDEKMPSEIEDHMELGNSKNEIQYETNEGLNVYTTSTQSYESTTTSSLVSTDTLYTGRDSTTNGYEPVTNQISYYPESIETVTTALKYLDSNTMKSTTVKQGLIAVNNLNSVENKTDKNFTTILPSSPLLSDINFKINKTIFTATDEYNKILQSSTMSAEESSTSSTNSLDVPFEEITMTSNPRIEESMLPYKESDIDSQTESSIKENDVSSSVLDEINPRSNQLLDKITSTGTYTSETTPPNITEINSHSSHSSYINYTDTTYSTDTLTTPYEYTTLLKDESSESSPKYSTNIQKLQHKIETLPTYDSNTDDVHTKEIKDIIEISKSNTDTLKIQQQQRISHILNTETPTIKQSEKPDLTNLLTKQMTYVDKYSFTLSPKINQSVERRPDMTQNNFFDSISLFELHPIINDSKTVTYSKGSILPADIKINYTRDFLTKLSNSEKNNNKSITEVEKENLKKVDVSKQDFQDTEINYKIPIVLNLSYDNKSKINTTQIKAYLHQVPSNSTELVWNITADKPNERVNKTDSHMSKQFSEQENRSASNTFHMNTVNETTTERNIRNVTLSSVSTKRLNFTCLHRYRGKYPDQNNCQSFYICTGRQQPLVGNCPQNSVFSDILNQCTRNLSHCIRNNQFKCVSPGRFCDLWARDTYYICVRGKEKFLRFKMKCQKGYYLNRMTVTCIKAPVTVPIWLKPSLSKESLSTSRSGSSMDSKSAQIQAENNEFQCEKEGIFPDANHCRKYYVCKKVSKSEIQLKKKKCDSDEVFNKKKKKCVDEDSYECKT